MADGAAPAITTPATPATPAASAAPASLADAALAATPPAGAASPAAGPAGAPAAVTGPYVPEGLPEAFKGTSEKEIIDKLWKAQQDVAKPPEKPDAYTLNVPDKLKGVLDVKNDSVLPLYREVAHKLGLSQQQFEGSVIALHEAMAEKGLLPKPIDPNAEFAALGEGPGDTAAKTQRGIQRVLEVDTRIKALATRQQIPAELAGELTTMLGNAKSTQAIEAILKLIPGEHGVQGGGSAGPAGNDYERSLRSMFPTMSKVV